MLDKRATSCIASILILASCLAGAVPKCEAQQTEELFTVADEIGLTLFGTPKGGSPGIRFSPDGKYFAMWTERGRLSLNRVEDSLRFYRSQDVEDFLNRPDGSQLPSPAWVVERSNNQGPIINGWRWLADSSGVAFLEPIGNGHKRLVLADLRETTIEPLTSSTEEVEDFDVHDRHNFVYTITDPAQRAKMQDERQAPVIVGTGRHLEELIFPDDPRTKPTLSFPNYLWAVVHSKRFQVKSNGAPIIPGGLALSPDGQSLITKMSVVDVPQPWEILYPPYGTCTHRILSGHYDPKNSPVHQYVLVHLQTGSITPLIDAPVGDDACWSAVGDPSWSKDGQGIVLTNTFVRAEDHAPSHPCVAVVHLPSGRVTCVERLKGRDDAKSAFEEGYHMIEDARFIGGDKRTVMVVVFPHGDQSGGTTEYQQNPDGNWQMAKQTKGKPEVECHGFEVIVRQSFKEPPLLVARNKETSRIIWDPNPQFKDFEPEEVSIYKWKDKEGREWKGGLYKPTNYQHGQHYPLVIQTHGFAETEFRPSGVFPTAFAARALAASGIMVLQVGGPCPVQTPAEGSCQVSGYEAGAKQLVSEGLVDPDKIGIIGFSRTCYGVMEMLTTSSLNLKAASITDGILEDYLQYMLFGDRAADDANLIIGAPAVGEGLQLWLQRSPGFNLDKVTAPLLVVGEGPESLLSMWQPYAGLHYLKKPVDLMMLNTDEHVLTNPAARMASQGGSVDWFRFWLQNYEDPDPTKAEQYARWSGLRRLHETNEQKSTEP